MPTLFVWKCPVCGTETEPSTLTPDNWISVGGAVEGNEVFDTWQCLSTYVQERAEPTS
jgi:hypothetical protein